MKPFSEKEITQLCSWLDNEQDFVFLETSRVTPEEYSSFLFVDPERWLVCEDSNQVDTFFDEAVNLQQKGYFLAGWISYEFGYLLEPSLFSLSNGIDSPWAVLGVFRKPLVFDHRNNNGQLITALAGNRDISKKDYNVHALSTNMKKREYLQAIEKIKEYIIAGDTYQVNYTLKLLFDFRGSAAGFYQDLRRNQSVSFGAWIRQGGRDVMSFSPELFFKANHKHVTVRPMKGTMVRGRTPREDVSMREALREDLKNRSENVMIVDLLRNDLGNLLYRNGGGTVMPRSLFDVEVYETLLQMTSTIEGIPQEKKMFSIQEILRALFPCGSVTGAPKIRTMEIIHELEGEPRGVYCGAIGFCSSEEAVFNVPIRTVELDSHRGRMGIGSGIVFDSDPDAEWDESLLKGNFLTSPTPKFQMIETLLWLPDRGYWLLKEHVDRLAASAAYFLFVFEREHAVALLEEKAHEFSESMRVKLLLHRDGTVEIHSSVLNMAGKPDADEVLTGEPLPKVVFSSKCTDRNNVHLYHKTTLRELYNNERQMALAKKYYEVLFTNAEGEVTEGSFTNIFIARDGKLLTPPVQCGLLAGTFRSYLLEKGKALEQVLTKEDIRQTDGVYVGNSVRGLVQVEVEWD